MSHSNTKAKHLLVVRRPSKRRQREGNPPFPPAFLSPLSDAVADNDAAPDVFSPRTRNSSEAVLAIIGSVMTTPWPYPRIIAHRCGGALAPENSLAGLGVAARLGCRGVEFDVMLSGDGVPFLMHDETLERTTDGRGAVAQTSYAATARLDAGAWFGVEFRGERVPSFEQTGKLCIELGLWANIEIKPSPGFERDTGKATASMTRVLWRDTTPAPLLSSFYSQALEAAHDAAPELPRGLLVERVPANWKIEMQRLNCVSLHCDHRHLTQSLARAVKDSGYWLLCWTVNDPETVRKLFSWGVDAIFTDRLDLIAPDFA